MSVQKKLKALREKLSIDPAGLTLLEAGGDRPTSSPG